MLMLACSQMQCSVMNALFLLVLLKFFFFKMALAMAEQLNVHSSTTAASWLYGPCLLRLLIHAYD